MTRAACAALLVAACYRPTYSDCAIECTPEGACPVGLTCNEEGFCRAPGAAGLCIAPVVSDAAPADAALCGNGRVDPGEDCDESDNATDDGCLPSCRFNRCGDGFVRKIVEQCDPPGNGCQSTCAWCSAAAEDAGAATYFDPQSHHCYRRFDQAVW